MVQLVGYRDISINIGAKAGQRVALFLLDLQGLASPDRASGLSRKPQWIEQMT
jgi:hypothetical protein